MNNRTNQKSSLLIWLLMLGMACALLGVSCKKDTYITDGGLAEANSPLSTYDYLAANQYHYFDTLIQIIDHLGLKDSVNQAGTFFAPTDFAINRVMQANNMASLDDLYSKITSKFLTQYMSSDNNLTLDNASTSVTTFSNWAGSTAGFSKVAGSYYVANSTLTYYTLEYIKINGALDGSSAAEQDDEADAVLTCQTTGIKTASGTNLNVLANSVALDLALPAQPSKTFKFNLDVVQNGDYSSTALQLDSAAIASYFGVPANKISDMLVSGTDSIAYYNLQSDGTYSNEYTANMPGFWMGSNGDVVNWGDDAFLYGELDPYAYILSVGAYPDNPVVGDTYTIRPAIVLTKADGSTQAAIFKIKITIVSP
ncbi:Fasciclin domain-containing protein [Arachidicoccus rhizosphaerae]|uniref:Fasciclin domain-containing protein n=1 Tax=Arachidicoccus rhizosphaerae TaxID=551991 RepID=A0A1H4BDU1_9BACT|nr:DUF4859 domain-containing protein [Arachidicoccus rhizosphaerae]SEA46267.1 Fasciclin domain-containing protein [Arachidicoccus rhizosphaerae]